VVLRLGRLIPLERLWLGNGDRSVGFTAHGRACSTLHTQAKLLGDVVVNGAGVGFLLGNTELGQHVDNRVRWNFQLPCQLVDADFRHR